MIPCDISKKGLRGHPFLWSTRIQYTSESIVNEPWHCKIIKMDTGCSDCVWRVSYIFVVVNQRELATNLLSHRRRYRVCMWLYPRVELEKVLNIWRFLADKMDEGDLVKIIGYRRHLGYRLAGTAAYTCN